ncbi:MAG: FKBP-type peptidyl-prolyl cis-trans isomerase [Candidatus Manganitrophus sp.]|nr:FKBP-type peptidyl-prolyl cis-trans isomerase [Candidatus Manganitrophus sp.]WDT69235.1 MAG: FKBP-type peptidyl-prolyl cis-trans isomerase [Candidatus Manganitrophus sp.]
MLFRFIAIVGLGLLSVSVYAADKSDLKTQKDKVSYSIGLDIGRNLKDQSIEVDPKLLAQGIQDATSGKHLLTDEEIQKVMSTFREEMQAKAAAQAKVIGDKNLKEGNAFLAENKKKKGVVTLPSGLQYKIITAGTGKKPKATDTVKTNYKGTLIDGTEFDSSYKRGEPASFPVEGVIPGWTEALQLMPVGSKWQLVVPPSLAYGPRGAGQAIGPNATLIFEVELLAIEEAGKTPQ